MKHTSSKNFRILQSAPTTIIVVDSTTLIATKTYGATSKETYEVSLDRFYACHSVISFSEGTSRREPKTGVGSRQ